MPKPLISVLIPTYNRADVLPGTLKSILLQKEDLFSQIELVISNDCSTDDTNKVIEQFKSENPQIKIRYFNHEKNLGGPGNWAFCLSQSQGDFSFLLSDDDEIKPDFLARYIQIINENPTVDLIYSAMEFCDEEMKTKKVSSLSSQPGEVSGVDRLKNQMLAHHMVMSSMYRTQTLREGGGWKGRYNMHLDSMAFVNCCLFANQTFYIDQPLFRYRMGAGAWSTFRVEKQKSNYIGYRRGIDDLIEIARKVKPELVSFFTQQYRIHVQSVLNALLIKMDSGNLTQEELASLLHDLSEIFPEAKSMASFYKMNLVSKFGLGWLKKIRQIMNKPELKSAELGVFENPQRSHP